MDGEKETIVIAMKPVHRLKIRPTVHNYRVPPTTPQVTCGSVQWCGNAARDRQTDRQTHTHTHTHTERETAVTNIHFASATPHAKFNHWQARSEVC